MKEICQILLCLYVAHKGSEPRIQASAGINSEVPSQLMTGPYCCFVLGRSQVQIAAWRPAVLSEYVETSYDSRKCLLLHLSYRNWQHVLAQNMLSHYSVCSVIE